MSYKKTLDYLFGRLPIYQREGSVAYKANIGNIVCASKYLGDPHTKFRSIHVGGTNGKGSTAHMLSSILQEANYKVGLYTSPHLADFRERIKINGKMISKRRVIDFVELNKPMIEELELSFFELTVALAFDYFANEKVDVGIIEVGLGGRLDSTNIIKPELSIITNISLDHTNLLGSSLQKIAIEKAGIIKRNTPIIIGKKQKETTNIFRKIAKNNNSELIYASKQGDYNTDLKGEYQKENINTCVTGIKKLKKLEWKIDEIHVKKGLKNITKNTALHARWEILNKIPKTICDTGHNEGAIKEICKQLKNSKYQQLHFVFGTVKEKDLNIIFSLLPKDGIYYFCKANVERAASTTELQKYAIKYQLKGSVFNTVKEAFLEAKKQANNKDLVFVGGSTFVVAEIL